MSLHSPDSASNVIYLSTNPNRFQRPATPPFIPKRQLPFITNAVIILPVITSFKKNGTKDIFNGTASKAARKCCPQPIWSVAQRKLDQINRVQEVTDLRIPPGNRLEQLKDDREDQFSIRINQQYRVCFIWEEGQAYEVEITDYH